METGVEDIAVGMCAADDRRIVAAGAVDTWFRA